MTSTVIPGAQRQMTLQFDESVLSAHRSLRDCVAAGVYRRGLKAVAADLDLSPGNLSVALSDDPHRKFSVDDLEHSSSARATSRRSTTWWPSTWATRRRRATKRWARCQKS